MTIVFIYLLKFNLRIREAFFKKSSTFEMVILTSIKLEDDLNFTKQCARILR